MPPGDHHIIATDLTPSERDTLARTLREEMNALQKAKNMLRTTPSEKAVLEHTQQDIANIMVKFKI